MDAEHEAIETSQNFGVFPDIFDSHIRVRYMEQKISGFSPIFSIEKMMEILDISPKFVCSHQLNLPNLG